MAPLKDMDTDASEKFLLLWSGEHTTASSVNIQQKDYHKEIQSGKPVNKLSGTNTLTAFNTVNMRRNRR